MRLYICQDFLSAFVDIVDMDFLGGVVSRLKQKGWTTADLIQQTKLPRSKVYAWFNENRQSIINSHDATTIAYALGDPVEVICDKEKGKHFLLEWAKKQGQRVEPPPGVGEDVLLVCELFQQMEPSRRKKMIDTIKIWMADEDKKPLESPPHQIAI